MNAVVRFPAAVPVVAGDAYPVSLSNLEAEAALLGALMIDNKLVSEIADQLDPDHFAEPLHAVIYAQIIASVDRGATATPVTLQHLFHDNEAMRQVGGPGYLARLTEQSGVLLIARQTASLIVDLAQRRKLWDGARALVEAAANPSLTKLEIVEAADVAMMEALSGRSVVSSVTAGQAWDTALTEIRDEASGRRPAGVRFHDLGDLNDLGVGFRPGNFIILGGRPGMCKTALAVKMAIGAAQNGHGVLYVTMEVPANEIGTRIIADRLFEPGNSVLFADMLKGRFSADDERRLTQEREAARSWPLKIFAPPSFRISRLALTIRRYQRLAAAKRQSLDLVILDHIGLIRGDSKRGKYEETTEVSNALKSVALETGTCILGLAQINRAVEALEDKRPNMSHLRDSGSLEQDADGILFVYREEYYLKRNEPDAGSTDPKVMKKREAWLDAMNRHRDRLDVFAGKARQGAEGRARLHFFGNRQAIRGRTFLGDQRA